MLDEIVCRAFPTTLKGSTRVWFSKLAPNTIFTFKEPSKYFVTHFIKGQRYRKSLVILLNIKQWNGESIRSYMTCFNKMALLIDEADNKVLVTIHQWAPIRRIPLLHLQERPKDNG